MKDPKEPAGGRRSLSEAVREGRWADARHLAAILVADAMERTQSARDVKALSLSLDQLIDKCEAAGVTAQGEATPLEDILRRARELEDADGAEG